MTLCGEASLVNHGPDHSKAVTLFCHSWGCPNCHDGRVKRLVKEIIQGHPERLLTLTCRPYTKPTPDEQAQFMSRQFRILIKWIREIWHDKDHQYFAVFEAHKSGWPHLHIAMRGSYMPHWWLSAAWEVLTGSPGVDIRKIYDPQQCGSYVAKYMGKDSHRFGKSKRYWKSPGWQLVWDDDFEPDLRFSRAFFIVPANLQTLARQWYHPGVYLWWEEDALIRGRDPPKGVATINALIAAMG